MISAADPPSFPAVCRPLWLSTEEGRRIMAIAWRPPGSSTPTEKDYTVRAVDPIEVETVFRLESCQPPNVAMTGDPRARPRRFVVPPMRRRRGSSYKVPTSRGRLFLRSPRHHVTAARNRLPLDANRFATHSEADPGDTNPRIVTPVHQPGEQDRGDHPGSAPPPGWAPSASCGLPTSRSMTTPRRSNLRGVPRRMTGPLTQCCCQVFDNNMLPLTTSNPASG